ncbi:hypothetical protein B0H16DRAFT_1574578 [Mycena metata]|uniref:MYND-type domain-containing protein n=1 Tax=Mycena metata TaxID=1033252 RepID=A0AAD7I6X8_9AGAR|nr:hypothetical protein B0H16DRAFT_1574578 [Mycena metata]
MCGNLACGKLDDNHDFKRCSDCRSRYYCSPECQVSDWRCGGHRQTCDTLYSRRCDTMYINAEDRAFMRVLLNHDYAEKQHEIALDELEWMHDHPSETPYMFFDYDEGKLELYFESPEDAPEEFAQELSDSITSRSGRRLHLMSVYAGDEVDPEVWILPLAAERTGLARGLRLLADSIPPDTDWKEIKPAYASKVQDLLNGGVPESRAR